MGKLAHLLIQTEIRSFAFSSLLFDVFFFSEHLSFPKLLKPVLIKLCICEQTRNLAGSGFMRIVICSLRIMSLG